MKVIFLDLVNPLNPYQISVVFVPSVVKFRVRGLLTVNNAKSRYLAVSNAFEKNVTKTVTASEGQTSSELFFSSFFDIHLKSRGIWTILFCNA